MKRILLVIILSFLMGCNNNKEKEVLQVKEYVLGEYKKAYPNEDFYFIHEPDYNYEKSQTNIRYRGILSTKTLEEQDYYNGFQVNLEKVDSPIDTRKYQNTLNYLEVYAPLKREAKEIFGENIIFEIEGTYTTAKFKHYLDNLGNDVEIKPSLGMVILSTFVEDLDQELENIDYWKEKMYQLGKKYWEYYNATGALQIYLYDKELLYNLNLVENSLNLGFKNDKKIEAIIEKLGRKEPLENTELTKLIKNFGSGYEFLGSKLIGLNFFTNNFKKAEELKIENIVFKNRLDRK